MSDWQVESGKRKTVFISSTSYDLGNCRELAKLILIESGIFPVVQDHFGPDHREIETMIYEKLISCDAVICLIGHYCGVIPSMESSELRSYTQIEFDFALKLSKPVYIFLASDDYKYSSSMKEPDEKKNLQQKHRERVLTGNVRYDIFSTNDELEKLIRKAITPILVHSSEKVLIKIHPPSTPAYFVGREEELSQLNQALFQNVPAIVAIVGMGGQGKTTLLSQCLKKLRYLPFDSGIWVEANCGGFTFYDFLDTALHHFLKNDFDDKKVSDFQSRISILIGYLQKKRTIIVIDGVEKWLEGWSGIEIPDSNAAFISSRKGIYLGFDDFLGQCSSLENGSHVIITTRALPSVLDNLYCSVLPVLPDKEKYIGLQGLQPEDAVNLLKSMGVVASKGKLEEIASRFFYHPLAITGFAGFALNYGSKWEEYLFPRGVNAIEAFHHLLDETRKHLPNPDVSVQLLKLASLSIDNPSVKLLNWLWHFDAMFRNESEDWLIMQVINLSKWNIFSWNPENVTISFHPLVKEHFSNLLQKEDALKVHGRIGAWHNSVGFTSGIASLEGARNKILAVKHYLLSGNINIALQIMFGSDNCCESLYKWFGRYGHLWECSELINEITSFCSGELKGQCILARSSVLNDLDLLEIAKDDIEEAISIFVNSNNQNDPNTLINLSKCFGTKGTLFLERNKTNVAISLFDQSLKLMKLASGKGITDHQEIAKSYANRGLAFMGIGDLSSASIDFSAAMDEINKTEGNSDEIIIIKKEISIQRIRLSFSEENNVLPLFELEQIVDELAQLQENGIRMFNRNYLLSVVFLGYAWNLCLNPKKAIVFLNEIITPLSKLEAEGIKNLRAILALGYVNRGQSYSLMGQYSNALEDLNVAVAMYFDHIKGNRHQYKGQLSNAFFIRARINYLMNNFADGQADVNEATLLGQEWIDQWFDDCDIKNVYLENAIETLSILPSSHIVEIEKVLCGVFIICKRLKSVAHSPYLSKKAIENIIMHKKLFQNRANETGISLPNSFFSLINE